MNFLHDTLGDLRERRLWLVAVALVVALIAVPVLLSKSATNTPVAQTPKTAPATATPATALPAVSVSSSPAHSRLTGKAHDPFTQQQHAAASAMTHTSGSPVTSTSGAPTSSVGSVPSSTWNPSPTTPTATAPASTTTPTTTPKPAPTGLTKTQAYQVALSITNSNGGFNTIDPLERLSIVPSAQDARLVELGVLKGGKRVLFGVEPGTVLSGPGTCTPGPIDCEILSLGANQVENLSRQSPNGTVPIALFAVTAIKAADYTSTAAADQARRMESTAGSKLLSSSTLSALSLFQYEPSIGAVVDLRNLTVGGS